MNVAIIPARIGSKRIPNKNIKYFFGKPIIAYSINEAISSSVFDKVIVSTDSEDIAKISREYGAEVPFIRPDELSDSFSGISDVMKHAINWLNLNGFDIENACCVYATAPFIKKIDIISGLNKLITSDYDYVLSVGEFESSVQRAVVNKDEKGLSMLFSMKNFDIRSQDFESVYFDAGQFCWGKKNAWINDKIFNNNTGFIEIPSDRTIDIDTKQDWDKAELLYKIKKGLENE
ncbi:pseudaminic acid cytidylyltransferase [Candidatus Woesearchaeota archaeon]|nr:pseudaminic acid cytidylyltransferase [Candidatus Woesearchaeota archaeon]MBT5400281.1 pseudaminic acid cytidylyltransferase [bacterium]